jgi:hypothetical protein
VRMRGRGELRQKCSSSCWLYGRPPFIVLRGRLLQWDLLPESGCPLLSTEVLLTCHRGWCGVIVLAFPPLQAGTGVPSLRVRQVQACACYACDRGSCHGAHRCTSPPLWAFASPSRRVARQYLVGLSASLNCSAGVGCPACLTESLDKNWLVSLPR